MNTPVPTDRYKNQRFPAEIMRHGIRLSFHVCLSDRDGAEWRFARGSIVTSEAVRQWCRKFGPSDANQRRRRRPQCGDQWHLDAVFLTIRGERPDRWRAVDQDGYVLDILVHSRRNTQAAPQCFRTRLKGCQDAPRVIMTAQLKRDGTATRERWPSLAHRPHGDLNHCAETSHQPTRQREQRRPRFTSPGHAQRFLSASGPIAPHVRPRRHRLPVPQYRPAMAPRFQRWREITGTVMAA